MLRVQSAVASNMNAACAIGNGKKQINSTRWTACVEYFCASRPVESKDPALEPKNLILCFVFAFRLSRFRPWIWNLHCDSWDEFFCKMVQEGQGAMAFNQYLINAFEAKICAERFRHA